MISLIWILVILPVVYFIFKVAAKAIRKVDIESKISIRSERENTLDQFKDYVSDKASKKAKKAKSKLDSFLKSDY